MTFVAVLVVLALGIAAAEIHAWLPFVADLVVRCAARLTPATQRDRFREEWREQVTTLAASDRRLTALVWAAGLLLAATRIGWPLRVKRGIDVVFSAIMLLTVAPILLVTSVVLALSSPGRVIVRQKRIGLNGRPFEMLTFRSPALGEGQAGPTVGVPGRVRLTRVGRLLSETSVDQLPQLVNVLRGDMSLVGPRPPRPEDFARYDDREKRRTLVTPGLTGIRQVNNRSDVDFATWADMDLDYVQNWSLRLDLKLLIMSIPVAILSPRPPTFENQN